MTIKELCEKTGRSQTWIYAVCKRLGRMPTIEEIEDLKNKKGRPKKYT